MIMDKLVEFADKTSVGTPNSTTVNVGSQIDLGLIGRDVGNGYPVYLVILVTTSIGSGGAATVSFKLSSDDSASIAVNGGQTTHWESDVFALAAVAAGKKIIVPLPLHDPTYEQFLGVQVTEHAGQALNAGAISAFLTLDPAAWKAYADAVN